LLQPLAGAAIAPAYTAGMNIEMLLMLVLVAAIAAIVFLVLQLRRNPHAADLRAEREANRAAVEAAGRLQGQLGAATAELEAARGRHERDAEALATLRNELEAARGQAGLADRSLAERS